MSKEYPLQTTFPLKVAIESRTPVSEKRPLTELSVSSVPDEKVMVLPSVPLSVPVHVMTDSELVISIGNGTSLRIVYP